MSSLVSFLFRTDLVNIVLLKFGCFFCYIVWRVWLFFLLCCLTCLVVFSIRVFVFLRCLLLCKLWLLCLVIPQQRITYEIDHLQQQILLIPHDNYSDSCNLLSLHIDLKTVMRVKGKGEYYWRKFNEKVMVSIRQL